MSKQPNLILTFRQLEQHADDFAKLMANYFKKLITNGVPYELASDMTRDLATEYWSTFIEQALGKADE